MAKKYSTFELWQGIEDGIVKDGDVFQDQEGNQFIFTGHSLQVYYTEKNEIKLYVGMCKGDLYLFLGNENEYNGQ